MVMVEGLATQLHPGINMWDVASPFVRDWIRDELGPEAAIADRLRKDADTLLRLPDLIRRIEDKFPAKGGAPDAAPLPEIELVWDKRQGGRGWLGYLLAALAGGGALWAAQALGWL
jgi:ubiquinone biosynthesis protein